MYLRSDSKFWGFRHKAASFGAVGETPPNQEPQPQSRRGLNLIVTPEGDRACHILPCQALGQGN